MGDITELLSKLQVSSASDDDTEVQKYLQSLISKIHAKDDLSAICQEIARENVLGVAKKALSSEAKETQTAAAELIAELAKVENCRILCVEASIVPILVEKMSTGDNATALQACRGLGNICYEYDGGRMCVVKAGGTEQLLALLKRAAELPNEPDHHQLRLVATGFLLNILNLYEATEEHPIDSLLLEVLCDYLDKFASDEDIPTHVLLSLSCMADSDLSRDLIITKDITPHLLKVLKLNASAEVVETCLELITNLAETECMKTKLATAGVCEAIIEVIDRHIEEPVPELSPPIIKTATDLLVLILVGDESMTYLYSKGNGPVYKVMVGWLTSSVEYLQIAGALAMGNFARNDTHCISMVENGIAELLLQVLAKNSSVEGDIRLQHALLSALRNLSIAEKNKPIIFKQKALETLLPMVSIIEAYPVVFKLLATLRMIIDGQKEAAVKVGISKAAVKKFVSWCTAAEHPGVQGEASRILSWIVKNCGQDDAVIECMQMCGAILPLVCMLGSEHAVMVNEAALALALAFTKCATPVLDAALAETPFVSATVAVLKREATPPEIVANVFSALFAFTRSEELLERNEMSELKPLVDGFCSNANEQVKSMAIKLKKILDQ